jgi:hypothetical protein
MRRPHRAAAHLRPTRLLYGPTGPSLRAYHATLRARWLPKRRFFSGCPVFPHCRRGWAARRVLDLQRIVQKGPQKVTSLPYLLRPGRDQSDANLLRDFGKNRQKGVTLSLLKK